MRGICAALAALFVFAVFAPRPAAPSGTDRTTVTIKEK
jgi:hypothetical protein